MQQTKLSGARWVAFGIVWLLALPVVMGCGSSYAKVTGKVKYKGQPLPSGKIAFIGKDGTEPGTGDIQEDGSYTVQAAPIGDCTVTIITERATQGSGKGTLDIMGSGSGQLKDAPKDQKGKAFDAKDEKAEQDKKMKQFGSAAPGSAPKKVVEVPPKYFSKETSGLTFQVKKGNNTFDLEVPE